jgi:starch synthase
MRILYITLENLSFQKGSVVHVKEVVNGLRELGHHVGLVANSLECHQKADYFCNLNRLPVFMLKLFGLKKQPHIVSLTLLFLCLFRILPHYDIIYARDFHTVIIALLPRLIFKKKLVFEINGLANEEQRLKRDSILNRTFAFFIGKAEKMAAKWSDRIVSVTPEIESYLICHFKCKPAKVNVVGNGVDTRKFQPIHDGNLLSTWRKRVGIGRDDIVIVFVGNLAPWQGIEYLVQVAPLLVKTNRNIRFLVIGDGVLKNQFEAYVNRRGLSEQFIFTGAIDHGQIPIYINISDICVIPKRRLKSGYSPIKLYEYMACGKPIVASRVAGLEFLEQEGAGRVVDPGDLISLEEALQDLLTDSQKRRTMGQKGLQIARERFNWELRVNKIENILRELA